MRKPNEGDKVTDQLLLVTAALWAVALIPLFVACGGQSDEPGPAATATQTLPLTASLTHPPTATPTPSPTATATPSPSPTPTPQAEFQLSGCQFEAPDTVDVLCGYLIVPEDRSDPDSQPISLHVAVFTSESEEPAPDPIVYLEGGPGGHALEIVPFIFEDRIAPFLTNRHFIVFDQRVVGYSEPNLDCPELIALTHETLDQQLSVEEQRAGGLSASLACRDRLIGEGVNLKAYTSAENAADLNALRQALGYEEWNLYGISYGTRLALTAMRDHPEGIRSVVLDSAYPLQVDLPTSLLSNADRAFSQLFGACRENPACSGAYPNLESTFFELVQRLNADPVVITITDPLSGEVLDYLLDGDRLMSFLFQSLYSELLIPLLPELIFDVEGGTYDSRDEVAKAAETYPRIRALTDGHTTFELCESWGARSPDAIENRPVKSDIPALVLAGEYDPITPPFWGRMVGDDLSNSFFFVFPGVGHGVSTARECPLSLSPNPPKDTDGRREDSGRGG